MKAVKTSEQWQRECNVVIIDPDGWDRTNYQYSWFEEKITRKEFEEKMRKSTCLLPAIQDKEGNISSIWK